MTTKTATPARPDLRKLCREDEITQKQLAEALGVSPPRVSQIVRGMQPPHHLMVALRDFFGRDEKGNHRCPLEGWESGL